MRKILISIVSIFLFQTTYSFWLDTLLLECIKAHNQAYTTLSNHRDQITLKTWTTHTFTSQGQKITNHYLYSAPSAEGITSIRAYQEALTNLRNRILINSIGDGFILGIIAALINRTFTKETFNKPALIGISLAFVTTIVGQSYSIEPTPHFSYHSLQKLSNLFSCFDPCVIGRIACMMLGTSAGYLGGSYILSRLIDKQEETNTTAV